MHQTAPPAGDLRGPSRIGAATSQLQHRFSTQNSGRLKSSTIAKVPLLARSRLQQQPVAVATADCASVEQVSVKIEREKSINRAPKQPAWRPTSLPLASQQATRRNLPETRASLLPTSKQTAPAATTAANRVKSSKTSTQLAAAALCTKRIAASASQVKQGKFFTFAI